MGVIMPNIKNILIADERLIMKPNMHRVGTNFRLKIGNFFLVNLFRISKKLFDVKNPSDSKYSIFIGVSRREVHESLVLKHEKLVLS